MSPLLEQLRKKLAPQYDVEIELASGGMGTVFLARDTVLERAVAVKVLRPEQATTGASRRLLNEARILARLSHPNIVSVYTAGEIDGSFYYVMDYIQGETLEAKLERGPLLIDEALRITDQLLAALEAAHEGGIIHRDIKPSNVFLVDERALLGDFGIAKRIEHTGTALTEPGRQVGTPGYMPPEQFAGDEVTPTTDVYAVGMVLFEALTGRKWSVLTSADELDLSGVPPTIARVLRRALAWSPDDRWTSAADFRRALLVASRRVWGVPALVQDLWRRRVPQILAVYLGASWGIVGFVDWLAQRFELAPEAIDVSIITLMSLVPAITILAYFRGGLRKPRWTKLEKIAIPVNLLVSASLIVFLLAGENLGLRAESIALLPEHKQVTFTGRAYHSAIAPDGNYFSYVFDEPDGGKRLLVQDVAGGQPIELAQYEDIDYMRWSPDGSQLAFDAYTEGDFHSFLVHRFGGDVRETTTDVYYDKWSPDGTKLAGISTDLAEIYFLDLLTNEETSIALSESFEWLMEVDWSPIGEMMVFLTRDNDVHTIWTIGVDGTDQQKIVEDSIELASVVWSPVEPAIYFLRSPGNIQELWKIGVSTASGEPRGSPEQVLTWRRGKRDPTQSTNLPSNFTLAADGHRLLHTRDVTHSNLWLITAGGSDREPDLKELTTGTAYNRSPRISPDGTQLAFRREGTVGADIFVMPLEGGAAEQLTFSGAASGSLAWSPSGDQIAFTATVGSKPQVWTVKIDDRTVQKFEQTEVSVTQLLWWGLGEEILYQLEGNRNFHVLDTKTGEERRFIEDDSVGWIFQPTYSPDGKYIALYWYREYESEMSRGLWLFSTEDTSRVRLYDGLILVPVGWSADAATLYAMGLGGRAILSIPVTGGEPDTVVVLPIEGEMDPWHTTMTPDAKRFVAAATERVSDVWIVDNFDPNVPQRSP